MVIRPAAAASHQPELAIEDIDVYDGAVVSVVEDIDLDDPPSLPPQPQPPAPAPAAPAPTGGLVGRAVLLNGLVARADLNGATGFVLSYDTARGRYVIRVVSSGELVNVRPANVSLLVHRGSETRPLMASPEKQLAASFAPGGVDCPWSLRGCSHAGHQ